MILCLDAGNSRLKWGLRDGTRWQMQDILAHADIETLAASLPVQPRGIVACNVAGSAVAARIEALATMLGTPLAWLRSSASASGVINGYDHPAQLGADRWAALIGARSLHAGAALVVMAGTATTIDTLDAAGGFRGGLILPGLDLMRSALAHNTAGLPEAQGNYRTHPTNTGDAIISGALHATLGAIERMARHSFDHATGADFVCLLSGGAAATLAPHLDLPTRRIDNLVLEGLARAVAAGDLVISRHDNYT